MGSLTTVSEPSPSQKPQSPVNHSSRGKIWEKTPVAKTKQQELSYFKILIFNDNYFLFAPPKGQVTGSSPVGVAKIRRFSFELGVYAAQSTGLSAELYANETAESEIGSHKSCPRCFRSVHQSGPAIRLMSPLVRSAFPDPRQTFFQGLCPSAAGGHCLDDPSPVQSANLTPIPDDTPDDKSVAQHDQSLSAPSGKVSLRVHVMH